MLSYEDEARKLERKLRQYAERLFYSSFASKLLTIVVGVIASFFAQLTDIVSLVMLVLYLLSELLLFLHQNVRGDWEYLQRRLDALNSLGWPIPNKQMSDLSTEYSRLLNKSETLKPHHAEYFASTAPIGELRALQNTQESAWYAKHIAKATFRIYLGLIGALVIVAMVALSFVIITANDLSAVVGATRGAIAGFTLLVSVNLFTFTLGYNAYARCADLIESNIAALLDSGSYTQEDAIRIMNEYHLCHASAPMNPSWIWKWKRTTLGVSWNTYRRELGGASDYVGKTDLGVSRRD